MKPIALRTAIADGDAPDNRQFGDAQVIAQKAAGSLSPVNRGGYAYETTPSSPTIAFTGGTAKRVLHGLALPKGATPGGWMVVDVDADSAVHRTAWDNVSITLQFATSCNARVWVFP